MARDDMLKLYTEKTGSPRPFTYDTASITGLSDFSNNILDLWSKANKVYMYSESPIYFMKYYYWPAAVRPTPGFRSGMKPPLKPSATTMRSPRVNGTRPKRNWDWTKSKGVERT